jgi:hypothetical protein
LTRGAATSATSARIRDDSNNVLSDYLIKKAFSDPNWYILALTAGSAGMPGFAIFLDPNCPTGSMCAPDRPAVRARDEDCRRLWKVQIQESQSGRRPGGFKLAIDAQGRCVPLCMTIYSLFWTQDKRLDTEIEYKTETCFASLVATSS